jgi:phage shock protein B
MEEAVIAVVSVVSIFVILPAMIFRSITQWKRMRSLSGEDENLLDDMNDTARKLEQRIHTIERILDAENPNWRKDR